MESKIKHQRVFNLERRSKNKKAFDNRNNADYSTKEMLEKHYRMKTIRNKRIFF